MPHWTLGLLTNQTVEIAQKVEQLELGLLLARRFGQIGGNHRGDTVHFHTGPIGLRYGIIRGVDIQWWVLRLRITSYQLVQYFHRGLALVIHWEG